MEEASTSTQTYTPQAGSRLQKSSRRSSPLPHVPNTKTKLDMSVAQAAVSAYSSAKVAPSTALASSTPSESLASGSGLYAPPSHPGITLSLSPPPWPLHNICIPLPPTILPHCDTFLSHCHPTTPIPHLQDQHASAEIPTMQTLLSSRNGLWYANFTPSTPKLALAPNSPLTLTGPTPIPAPKNATPTTTIAVGIDSSAQGPGDSGLAPIDADTYEFDENLLSVSAIQSVPAGGSPNKVLPITLKVDTSLRNDEQKRFHDYCVRVYRDELPHDMWAVTGQPLFVAPSSNTRHPTRVSMSIFQP